MKWSRVKTNCIECGKEIYIKKYLINKPTKTGGRFCSPSCRSKYNSRYVAQCQPNRVKTSCAYCGKELLLEPYRILEKNFCSNSCRGKYGLKIKWPHGITTQTVTCSFCNKSIEIPKWEYRLRLERGQIQFFCDRVCFSGWKSANWNGKRNPSWKGGWTPHGTGWDAVCEIVRHEQNYTCEDCGVTEKELGRALDVHHKIPARLFANRKEASNRENLVGLCHPCHMRREYEQ